MLKCLLIFLIPVFLLDFLNGCLLQCVVQLAVSKVCAKTLAKVNLLWFLGKTDKRRYLGISMARAFCGTVFQLLFQLVLILRYFPWSSIASSQLCSIGSSLFVLMKTATEVIMFKEEKEDKVEEEEKGSVCQKVVQLLSEKLDLLKNMFRLLPLLLTNAAFNIGTTSLLIAVLGRSSAAILFFSFIFDMVIFYLPFVDKIGFQGDQKSPSFTSGLFTTWTSFFLLAGQQERKSSTFFCVLSRSVFNFAALLAIVCLFGFSAELRRPSVIAIVLGVCGVVFLSLLCNSEWAPRKTTKSEVAQN